MIDISYREIEITNSKAKCMDGSNYKFLKSNGFGSGKNSYLIYFEAGGFCGGDFYDPDSQNYALEYCAKRLGDHLSSNKFTFIQKYFIKYYARYLSNSWFFNPNFYNWNKIYVKYCDGALYIATKEDPVIYNNKTMFIRGEDNVKSVLEYLQKETSFTKAENVLVSGSSAGGIASGIWSQTIKKMLSNETKYKVIVDSGFFQEYNTTLVSKLNGKEVNIIVELLERLVQQFKLPKSKTMLSYCKNERFRDCLILNYWVNEINLDYEILLLTSYYDSWSLSRIVNTKCFFKDPKNIYDNCSEKEKKAFEEYSLIVRREVEKITNHSNKITAWIAKGFYHTFIYYSWQWNNKIYKVEGMTAWEMVNAWYFDDKKLNKNKRIYSTNEIQKNQTDFYWNVNNKELFK